MGMYDSFFFAEGILPENPFPPEKEFQTKSLGCWMDEYTVDKHGRVVKKRRYSPVQKGLINECAHVYTYVDGKEYDYKILIHNSKLVFVEKLEGEND